MFHLFVGHRLVAKNDTADFVFARKRVSFLDAGRAAVSLAYLIP